jgi:hypothetical protein
MCLWEQRTWTGLHWLGRTHQAQGSLGMRVWTCCHYPKISHQVPHQKSPGWKCFFTWHYVSQWKSVFQDPVRYVTWTPSANQSHFAALLTVPKQWPIKVAFYACPPGDTIKCFGCPVQQGYRLKSVWIGTVSKLEFYLAPFGLNLAC